MKIALKAASAITILTMLLAGFTNCSGFQIAGPSSGGGDGESRFGLSSIAREPDRALIVDQSSQIVVMGYEPWFGPKGVYYANAPHQPLLTSASARAVGRRGYDSADASVIRAHAAQLEEAGVDALLVDHSNGTACTFGDFGFCGGNARDSRDHMNKIKTNIEVLYREMASNGSTLKLIPLMGGGEVDALSPNADGESSFEKQVRHYIELQRQYPQLSVLYEGKPLVTAFVGAGQSIAPDAPWRRTLALARGRFGAQVTIRNVIGYTGQQPQLSTGTALGGVRQTSYEFWNWLERLNPERGILPAYNVAGSRVEAFTVHLTSIPIGAEPAAWKHADGSYDAELSPRLNGLTLKRFMYTAQQLKPIFLIMNQWNCFCTGADGGVDFETTNDFEPSTAAGAANFDVLKEQIARYRTRSPDAAGRWIANVPESPAPPAPPASAGAAVRVEATSSRLARGIFITPEGAVFGSNGANVCAFESPAAFVALTGLSNMNAVTRVPSSALIGQDSAGDCRDAALDFAPPGLFRTPNGAVYNSNGVAFCGFPSPERFVALTGLTSVEGVAVRALGPSRLRYEGECSRP